MSFQHPRLCVDGHTVNILDDVGRVSVLFYLVSALNDKRGRKADTVLSCFSLVLLADYLLIGDTCAVKMLCRTLTVRAGAGGEQHNLDLSLGSVAAVRAAAALVLLLAVLDRSLMVQMRGLNVVDLSLLELLRLSVVPVLNGAVVARNTAVYLGLCSAIVALIVLAGDVTVILADGVGRAEGVVRQLIVLGDLANEVCSRLP